MLKSRRPNLSLARGFTAIPKSTSKWPDGSIIANPRPYPDAKIAQIIAEATTVDIASIDEYHPAEIAGDREAQFNTSHQQAVAADRPPLAVQRADPIGRIAADAARSTREEAHIRWDRLAAGVGFDTPHAETGGQDDPLRTRDSNGGLPARV